MYTYGLFKVGILDLLFTPVVVYMVREGQTTRRDFLVTFVV